MANNYIGMVTLHCGFSNPMLDRQESCHLEQMKDSVYDNHHEFGAGAAMPMA